MSNLLMVARRAEEALRKVVVPGFDVDLISSGLVKRIRVSRDGGRVAVFVDYSGSDPSCFFCRFINWTLWSTVLRRAEEELRRRGFVEVEFFDHATGLKIEYK